MPDSDRGNGGIWNAMATQARATPPDVVRLSALAGGLELCRREPSSPPLALAQGRGAAQQAESHAALDGILGEGVGSLSMAKTAPRKTCTASDPDPSRHQEAQEAQETWEACQ